MELTNAFNLSSQDIWLILTCPFLAGFASLIRGYTSEIDLLRPPAYKSIDIKKQEIKTKQSGTSKRQRGYWTAGMFLAGFGIGAGIAFLFLGIIQPSASAAGRIWLLSLILGYSTPIVLRNIDAEVENKIMHTKTTTD